MNLKIGERGSIADLILWFGIIVAIGIAAFWYFDNFLVVSQELEFVGEDLSNLRKLLDDACESSKFSSVYNPLIEHGELLINDVEICINSKNLGKCRLLLCETSIVKTIDLEKYKEIVVEKQFGIIEVSGLEAGIMESLIIGESKKEVANEPFAPER